MRGTALRHVPPSAHGVHTGPARAAPGAGRPNAGGSRSRSTVACAWCLNAGGSRSRSTVACARRPRYPTRLKSRSRHLVAVRPVTARAYRARQEASIVASSTRLGSKSASIRSSTRVTTSGTPAIASR